MERFQHYEILKREDGSLWELGRGAMGVTYRAQDTLLHREVALKVVNNRYLENDTARQRFQREARAAARITHENVAMVYQFGVEEDSCYYAMEYVRGETIEHRLNESGAMSPALAVRVTIQVCRALSAAEKEGLIHRDIKPANLMLMENDEGLRVKVIDFGLAKPSALADEQDATLTIAGFVGTPYFASPEQLGELDLDIRSDIYSLGVTLWFMLSGRPPFAGTFANLVVQHLHSDLPVDRLPSIPPQLVEVLKKSLAKDREDRFKNPAEFRAALQDCLPGLSETVGAGITAPTPEHFETQIETPISTPPPLPSVTPKPRSPDSYVPGMATQTAGRPNMLAAGAAIVLLVVIAGASAIWFTKPKTPAVTIVAAPQPTSTPAATPIATPVAAISTPTPTPVQATPTPMEPTSDSGLVDALELAKTDEEAKKIPEAIAQYVQIIAKYPSDPRARTRIALLFQDLSAERSLIADPKPLNAADRAAAEQAAESGVASAQLFLGEALRKSDPNLAAKWLVAAVDQKNPRAMIRLANLMAGGSTSLPNNPSKVIDLLTLANDLGDPEAKLFLGDALLQKTGDLAPFSQPAKGIELLKEAASLGNGAAMNKLGNCYDKGIGVAQDDVRAFEWYEDAYDAGLVQATANLGIFYINGRGTQKNPKKAVEIFREGAEKNDPDCLYFYGSCLYNGLGIAKNQTEAKTFLAQAARLGNTKAIADCKELGIPFDAPSP